MTIRRLAGLHGPWTGTGEFAIPLANGDTGVHKIATFHLIATPL
jgi:hypothetical protein